MSTYSGQRVLITGAGSGIGALLAQRLAALGAEVVVSARRREAAEQVCQTILDAGGKAHARVLDVSDLDSILPFRAALHREIGPIDVLVNNAGVVFGGTFEEVSLADHLNTFQINTLGLVAMTHAFLDDLKSSRHGHLVNIASASAYVGLPFGSTYAASKWAVLGFSESLRVELQQRGLANVSVTTVCPGLISTGMFNGATSPLLTPLLTPEKVVKAIVHGMQHRQALIQQPTIIKGIDFLKGALPLPVWDSLANAVGLSSSMKDWKGKHD